MSKPAYHHGDLRTALLDAGEALLAERGLEGFTLRELARRVGVSNAAPAHHFPDVAALLTELAANGFERLTQAMATAAAPCADPVARLVAIGRAYVATAIARPAIFRLMFHSKRVHLASPRLLAASAEAYGALRGALAALPAATPRAYADTALAWCVVHGFAVLCIEGGLQHDPAFGAPEDWSTPLEAVLQRMVRGLGAG
ncbi:TetR/AcrR family transcriptional regulator [Plastoroseomonas arctica]|uniref:TetR/AcrR family transcriptional regulator n=1 Tax=Plastoroseomonas arctica TaxID=1509237 RepID=A0AAF1K3I6_9PROT|nr:TetR/AcrR family transcriptional regulator [Plastoroseomonas arctica]MBR0656088.1 TetR/AcrR family transcriptional regulator [Plastoroseomonas arctica]